MSNYRLTAREFSGTTIWSIFDADTEALAVEKAKAKLRYWEYDHAHNFSHARLWKKLFGVPMLEVAYLEPEDWRKND